MYGCDVEASAEPMLPSSRKRREAAISLRRAVILRAAGAVPGAAFAVVEGSVAD